MSPFVIWNPDARQTSADHAVRELLVARGCTLCDTTSREHALKCIAEAVERGVERIVAAGGDGSANVVLQGLDDADARDTTMAVLPLGTGNDLARSLGLPLDQNAAVERFFVETTIELDVVECRWDGGRRVVANMSTAGNTGLFMETLTDEMKQRWGPFCYLRGVVDVLRDLQAFHVEVRLDGARLPPQDILNVFVANGRTSGGGLDVAPNAALDDGWIDLVLVRDGTAGEIAGLTATYLFSDFLEHDLIVHRRVRRIEFHARPAMPVSIDGDLVTEGPVEYAMTGRKVRVVALPPATASPQ